MNRPTIEILLIAFCNKTKENNWLKSKPFISADNKKFPFSWGISHGYLFELDQLPDIGKCKFIYFDSNIQFNYGFILLSWVQPDRWGGFRVFMSKIFYIPPVQVIYCKHDILGTLSNFRCLTVSCSKIWWMKILKWSQAFFFMIEKFYI